MDETSTSELEQISFEYFSKADIRIGTVIEAEEIPSSNKMARLVIDFGFFKKNVLAGIKGRVDLNKLKGKQIPVLVNIVPRKTSFGLSEAMILVAVENVASKDEKIILLQPSEKTPNGTKIY